MRISDWNSDVCSSDLCSGHALALRETNLGGIGVPILRRKGDPGGVHSKDKDQGDKDDIGEATRLVQAGRRPEWTSDPAGTGAIVNPPVWRASRSEEHTSELQSLMRTSDAVLCLKKKTHTKKTSAEKYRPSSSTH